MALTQSDRDVVISRLSADASTRGKRVYVTGPHFSGGDGFSRRTLAGGIFSSTASREDASRFTRADADYMLGLGKWSGLVARIEPAAVTSTGTGGGT